MNFLHTLGQIQGPITLVFIFIGFLIMLFMRFRYKRNFNGRNTILHLRILGVAMGIIELSFIIAFASIGAWWHLLYGDMCSFMGLVTPFVLLTGNKKIIKSILPWLFIGAFLTLSSASFEYDSTKAWLPDQLISYFKHALMMIIALYGLITIGKYKKYDYFRTIIFIFLFILFVIILTGSLYWTANSKLWKDRFGMFSTAMFEPSYRIIVTTLKGGTIVLKSESYTFMNNIAPYPWPTLIFYPFAVIFCLGIAYGSTFLSQWFNMEKVETPKLLKWIRSKKKKPSKKEK
ncbi:hypothetical protein MYMA111404_04330 [Mycoplasma marinum]|uniref:Uncharacterized protein n=1 Tax=Mycoplasma marinum TaxID=1937190 RepID=A0A4R0XJ94_9MOLU|nr:hypothetical protein [Mycoplasma marinum]TCG10683.1 hypothetical protein C4B24_04195 [Mycoplasma marinum]